MKWNKIPDREKARDYLPKDEPFLALWKGAISLCEYDEDEGAFYLGYMPASMTCFWKLAKDREVKFTHWCELSIPEDY